MWPWEHAAVGYLGYAAVCRLRGKEMADGPVLALLVGTQLPDLVDKPLAWGLGVLPAGRSLGHSLLVAVPLCVVVWLVARHYQRSEAGLAFTVGYLLHLPADVISPVFYGGPPHFEFLFWPLVSLDGPGGPGLTLDGLLGFFTTSLGIAYLLGELVLLLGTLALWRRHGYPGVGWVPIGRQSVSEEDQSSVPAGSQSPQAGEVEGREDGSAGHRN